MVATLEGVKLGSLVHKFITAGKPGNCKLCDKFVEKLEAHHVCYDPEITIDLCHDCHHKVHFWPNRLTTPEKEKMLLLRFSREAVKKLLERGFLGPSALAQLVAPSRRTFIREHINKLDRAEKDKQALKQKEALERKHILEHRKLFKDERLSKNKPRDKLKPL